MTLKRSLRLVCFLCDVSVWFVYFSRYRMLTYCRLCLGVASKSCQAVKLSRVGFQNYLIALWDVKIE